MLDPEVVRRLRGYRHESFAPVRADDLSALLADYERRGEALREVLKESALIFHPGEDGCRLCDLRLKVSAVLEPRP